MLAKLTLPQNNVSLSQLSTAETYPHRAYPAGTSPLRGELLYQQELLMEYIRQAVTQENMKRFADQVLISHEAFSASTLAEGTSDGSPPLR